MSSTLSTTSKIRVRYGETDKMGVVYYGNYALYFEIGRTDWIRQFGKTYSELEKQGIIMPVVHMQTRYIAPAYYDEELSVVTEVKEKPSVKITFHHHIFNPENKLINESEVVLAFVNHKTGRAIKSPDFILSSFR